ncbi:MAG: HTH-type transcriptional regulator, sugar sensing transcriptional regulator [Thermoplasmata archaeon]|jgi:sugar-specific transcriptional regulator TrmB|nr:HTH-type transcriptional regulator, sugar sensing transcriptional regulator [Thermoplasmata archaeon]
MNDAVFHNLPGVAMLELLEGLGLSTYEAKALAHLLRMGPRTAPDLSRETGIPFGRVYDTLHALVERGLATGQAGRPRVFTAAPAHSVPQRLLAAGKRRLQDDERGMAQQAAALEAQMARLQPRAAPASTVYGVRLGEDAARDFLVEATHGARRSIDAYLSFEKIADEDLAIFEAFREAVARGVRTRLLLRERDVDYLLSTPYVPQVLDALLPHLGDTLQVRLSPNDSNPFSVLDQERVVLGVRNPLDPRSYFAVVHLDDRAFAEDLVGKFDTLWRDGRFDPAMVQRLVGPKAARALLRLGAKARGRGRPRKEG